MILIHGDCGSGKSRALHALEFAPPAGYDAVYVPVPTLEFVGLVRWCLDRLNAPPGDDPIAALRAVTGQRRVLLLVDDADRLPLETALALRQFERDAKGQLAIVAACGDEEQRNSALVALGEPRAVIALAPERESAAEEAAAEVRAALGEGVKPAPAKLRPQQLVVRAPEEPSANAEPQRARELPAPGPMPAPTPARTPSPAPAPLVRSPRSVPLSLTIALVCAAFLIPVAFGAGFVLGREPVLPELAADASADLPAVAAAPPAPDEREPGLPVLSPAPTRTQAVQLPPPAREESPRSRDFAPPPAAPAPVPAAAPQPAPKRVAASPRPSPAARPAESAAEVENWGTPALISVGPAPDAP